MTDPASRKGASAGVLYALAAYGLWGVAPAYWKLLGAIPPDRLLAHRVLWSMLTGVLLVAVARGGRELLSVVRSPRHTLPLVLSAALIGTNWLVFLWAVASDRVLDTSLGYYINPLINVVFGVLILRETLRPAQAIAVLLAAAGVIQLVVAHGRLPWISLVLAMSFALYGLVRKLAPVQPIVGFTVETALLAPLAGVYMFLGDGPPVEIATGSIPLLLVLAGPFTAAPLVCFNFAAKRLRLSTIGLFQYLAPSMAFVLAVAVYDEPFSRAHAVTFACVWLALIVYSVDSARAARGT